MAQETPKEKAGGMAYEVILKPASSDSPARPPSPPKEKRPLSQEFIEKKLKDAEERRQSVEAERLKSIAKDKERAMEANQRVQELNQSFSKEAEKKLSEKLETMEDNKKARIQETKDRLREHAKRVEEVRKAGEKYIAGLKERIDHKMLTKQANREAQIQMIQDKIKDHEEKILKAVSEVDQMEKDFSKTTEERLIQKMNTTLKNREDQLKQIVERVQEHSKHIDTVRKNKENQCDEENEAEKA